MVDYYKNMVISYYQDNVIINIHLKLKKPRDFNEEQRYNIWTLVFIRHEFTGSYYIQDSNKFKENSCYET